MSRTPNAIAEELVKQIGDADDNTAFTALEIARLLVQHRMRAQLDFERECVIGETGYSPESAL